MRRHRIHRPKFTTMADGTDAALTIHELVGEVDGPTIGVSGSIHGNENAGSQIIRELWPRLRNRRLAGRILLLPVANPRAFAVNKRYTPVDELNLNRQFPGSDSGWYSDHLAAAITREFLNKIDVHVDLHAGTDRPTVDYVYILNDERLSRAFGSLVLYRPKTGVAGTTYDGTTKSVTVDRRGISSVVVELGGGIVAQQSYVDRGVAGVMNMLRAAGVVEGEALIPTRQVVVRGIEIVRPKHGGWLETSAPPLGELIFEGEELGRVVSPYTFETLEVIPTPVPRGIMILSHLNRNVVEPGDYAYMVGDMDTAEAQE
ncbi:MAG: succinylglutamate desuccinylase/aspartoacylase family protein [Rhodobacteraceae bacterium]|nr:succinylglutamate desuccinylase/aspartoacylase family protein [Paracoccaceae bacterium]